MLLTMRVSNERSPWGPSPWKLYGEEDPQIIAGGHSHAYCMLAALQEGRGPLGRPAAVAYSADPGIGPPGDERYWKLVAAAAAERTVALVWNGNQHNAEFLISPDPPFRVFHPMAEGDSSGDGIWVAQEALREHWSPTFSQLSVVLEGLAGADQVIVLGTPPPKSELQVRQALAQEAFFVDRARELGVRLDQLCITPAPVRLAMWQVIQDRLQEVACDAGATFIPVPAAAFGQNGMLLPAFCAPDASHANSSYGALMWEAITACLAARIK